MVLFPALTAVLADLTPSAPLALEGPAVVWLTAGVLTTTGVTAIAPVPDTPLAPPRALVTLAWVWQVWQQALMDLTVVAEATAADCLVETAPPVVQLHGVPATTAVGHPVPLTVTATAASRIATLALWINDQAQPLDAAGRTTYTPRAEGPYAVRAVAQDGAGTTGHAEVTFVALDAAQDTAPPVAALAPLNADAPVTAPTVVRGTIEDATLVRWSLAISPRGAEHWTTLATGTTAVPDGVLGTLDPTLLPNDLYEVRLVAEDVNGQVTTTTSVVQVSGGMKIGHLRFTLEDLSLPLPGLPVTVARTYDSRDTSPGDFGAGWRLDLQTTKLRLGRPLGTDWTQDATHATFPRSFCLGLDPLRTVTITLPDGRQEVFDLIPTTAEGARHSPTFGKLPPQCQWLVPIEFATAVYQPRPGTLSTLEALADKDLIMVGGPGESVLLFSLDTLDVYAPTRFRLTTPEGLVLVLNQDRGVEQLTDPTGNTLTFGPDGIRHSAGTSVVFTRDGQGRITRLTDPLGHTLQYAYDAAGDLVAVTDQEGQTTRYTYDTAHQLLAITDPHGVTVAQTRYDAAGRLVAHIDAAGRRIDYTHNIAGRREVVQDRLGHVTVYTYDERGNVLNQTDPLGHTTTYTYDAQGNVLTETDPLGHTTTYTYDTQGNVLTETDPLGQTTTSTYNARRQLLTRTAPLGHTTIYTYDTQGNLLTQTDALGQTTTYTYSATSGRLLAMTDPLGHTTQWGYNAAGQVIQQTNPLGQVITQTYDANGNPVTTTTRYTDGLGNPVELVTTQVYDRANRLFQTTDAFGQTRQIAYTAHGQVAASIDAHGQRVTYTYDASGRLISTTFPDGTIETTAYDANGNLLRETDRAGHTFQYEYDALGRQSRISFPDRNSISTGYDAAGRIITTTDERGYTTSSRYNSAGRLTHIVDPAGHVTAFTYDTTGHLLSQTNALGQTTQFIVDALGRRIHTHFPDGTHTVVTYDALGQKIAQTDQNAQTTRFAYDAAGHLIQVVDSLGHTTTWTYDASGNKLSQTDANGHTTRWAYDRGRLVTRTLPLGMTEHFTYDAHGRVHTQTDFRGQTTTLMYDADDRLQYRVLPDSTQVSYTYTVTGQRATVTDPRGTTTYRYDLRDRLQTVTHPDGTTIRYTYDAAGNRTTLTTPAGTTHYTYDARHRLQTVVAPTGSMTSYTYDPMGHWTRITRPNGATTHAAYDTLNRFTEIEHVHADGSLLARYTYTWGATGQRQRVVELPQERTVDYTYDARGRLLTEIVTQPARNPESVIYTYDAVGNRLTTTTSSGTTPFSYDANDRLLTAGDVTYDYDANGNLVQQTGRTGTTHYTYDSANRLIAVQSPTHTVAYAYDPDGVRIGMSVDGMATHWLVDTQRDLAQVVEERTGGGVLKTSYVYGESRLSQEQDGQHLFYHTDGLGSTRLLTNAQAQGTDTYTYDAFGRLIEATGATQNPFLFAGEQYDAFLGGYYLRARYYAPGLGRFLTRDPHSGWIMEPRSLHHYLYAWGDPVNKCDPSGLATLTDLQIGAAVRYQLSTLIRGLRFLETINKVATLADMVSLVTQAVNVLGTQNPLGPLGDLFSSADPDFARILSGQFWEEALLTLRGNLHIILAEVLRCKKNAVASAMSNPRTIFVLYMPTPLPIKGVKLPQYLLSTGLSIRGKPLQLWFGAASGQGGRLLGAGAIHNKAGAHTQFFRMDWHKPHGSQDCAQWPSGSFHFHVP